MLFYYFSTSYFTNSFSFIEKSYTVIFCIQIGIFYFCIQIGYTYLYKIRIQIVYNFSTWGTLVPASWQRILINCGQYKRVFVNLLVVKLTFCQVNPGLSTAV